MHLIDNGNLIQIQHVYMYIYWLIENFLCSFLNYSLIEFLQSNMIQFVACTLQYCMIMYSTDILRKLQLYIQCISQLLYVKILQFFLCLYV